MFPTLIFILLMIVPGILYTLASFYHLEHPDRKMWIAILIAIGFAACEYVVKVPIISYGHKNGLSRFKIQVVWIVVTLALAFIADRISGQKSF